MTPVDEIRDAVSKLETPDPATTEVVLWDDGDVQVHRWHEMVDADPNPEIHWVGVGPSLEEAVDDAVETGDVGHVQGAVTPGQASAVPCGMDQELLLVAFELAGAPRDLVNPIKEVMDYGKPKKRRRLNETSVMNNEISTPDYLEPGWLPAQW